MEISDFEHPISWEKKKRRISYADNPSHMTSAVPPKLPSRSHPHWAAIKPLTLFLPQVQTRILPTFLNFLSTPCISALSRISTNVLHLALISWVAFVCFSLHPAFLPNIILCAIFYCVLSIPSQRTRPFLACIEPCMKTSVTGWRDSV